MITTVAGGGTLVGGDNGPATSGQLNSPYGVAVDSAGNVYISDNDFNGTRKVLSGRIHKVSSGVITTAESGEYLDQLPFARHQRLLGGWEIAGIASARTGLPVNITVPRSASALPDGNTSSQRPNLVPGVPIYAASQMIDNWFIPAAFSAPANGTWGNLGRNIANGPGAFEIDSSLQKRFRVNERLPMNFRRQRSIS